MTGKYSWTETEDHKALKVDVDFDKKLVYLSNGKPFAKAHPFSKENVKEIQWVIENNIEHIKNEIKRFKYKLSITETKYVAIDNGYRIFEPPTDIMKKKLKEKIKNLKNDLDALSTVDLPKLIKSKK